MNARTVLMRREIHDWWHESVDSERWGVIIAVESFAMNNDGIVCDFMGKVKQTSESYYSRSPQEWNVSIFIFIFSKYFYYFLFFILIFFNQITFILTIFLTFHFLCHFFLLEHKVSSTITPSSIFCVKHKVKLLLI